MIRRATTAPVVCATLCALPLGGCAWNGPMSTLVARSDLNAAILHVYTIITVLSALIAAVVFGVLAWVLYRYRARPGATASQTRGHGGLEIAWTIAPAVVLLIIAVPTIQVVFRTQSQAVPPGSLQVTVRGWQWWWEFRYPELGVVTANELHLPAGREVALTLDGPDVIHSFWVPHLGGKRDVVPGRENRITLTPSVPGEYWGQCAEFCGASHANMRMRVFVDAPEAFDRWVTAQRAAPAEPSGDAAQGKDLFARSACVGCHTIRGVSAGIIAPDLTHFGSRTTLAAGLWPNTADNVARWVKDPPALKPGTKMPDLGLSVDQAKAIAAYLEGLK